MQAERSELYREKTGWAAWVHLLLWAALGGSALTVFLGAGDASEWTEPHRLIMAGVILGSGLLIQILFGGLTVVVERTGLRIGLGNGWVFRTYIPFSQIESMETVTYHPIKEFGGWGLRGSKQKRAWTARGNRAVVLTLDDGRRVYVGSDEPARLEARIRNAMGAGSTG
jgi:hypothetical protein